MAVTGYVCSRCSAPLEANSLGCRQCGLTFEQEVPANRHVLPFAGHKLSPVVICFVVAVAIGSVALYSTTAPNREHERTLSGMFETVGQNVRDNKDRIDSFGQEDRQYAIDVQYPYVGDRTLKVVIEPQSQLHPDNSDIAALYGDNHSIDQVECKWVGMLYGYAIQSGFSERDASEVSVYFFDAEGNQVAVRTPHDYPRLSFPTLPPTRVAN